MSNSKDTTQKNDEGGTKKMIQRSVHIDLGLWNRARQKSIGIDSLSSIIAKLLRAWIEGRINLDDIED